MLLTVIVGKCRDLLQAMASQAMQRLQHFNSQNISNTLWAFASLNHHPGPMLLKVLQRELVHKLRQFTPQGIENVLWAFATLGHHPGQSQGQTTCKLLNYNVDVHPWHTACILPVFSRIHIPAMPPKHLLLFICC